MFLASQRRAESRVGPFVGTRSFFLCMTLAEPFAILTEPASPASVLALVTTIHLGLAALRNHRTPGVALLSSLTLISLALAGFPWMFPSTLGLTFGLAVHALWFVACEMFVPKRVGTTPISVVPVHLKPATVPAARPSAALTPRAAAPKSFVQVPVIAVFDETPTIKTIRVARPDGFEFEAGQFITVRMRVDGKDYARCYSISSAPHVRGYLEISVRRQGVVSNALHATVRSGAQLSVKAPAGAFRYPAGDDRPIVLLAGGIGITPLMSMLRHAVAVEPTRPVTLIYSARTPQDFAFKDELSTAANRHPQLSVYLAVSSGSTHPSVYSGRIDESLLRTTVPNLVHSIAFVCGPREMIEGLKTLLAALGVPSGQIRHEVFQAAVAASAGLPREAAPVPQSDEVMAPAGPRAADVASSAVVRSRARSGGHRMVCARTGRDVSIREGQTLLEAAEEGGVPIDSLCRAGVCGTCRVQVRDGEVCCESNGLDADDERQGVVFACVTTAKGDCTVNL